VKPEIKAWKTAAGGNRFHPAARSAIGARRVAARRDLPGGPHPEVGRDGLRSAGNEIYQVKPNAADQRDRPSVGVASMHRVRALVSARSGPQRNWLLVSVSEALTSARSRTAQTQGNWEQPTSSSDRPQRHQRPRLAARQHRRRRHTSARWESSRCAGRVRPGQSEKKVGVSAGDGNGVPIRYMGSQMSVLPEWR
jgi:hypothetical protein